mmetsp:Transcript_42687/g.46341  ORF Transcript_42687/g.46341 Transcript_42687/m.46341 type:complete len:96 (+) Transcript_42687:325-612(+)
MRMMTKKKEQQILDDNPWGLTRLESEEVELLEQKIQAEEEDILSSTTTTTKTTTTPPTTTPVPPPPTSPPPPPPPQQQQQQQQRVDINLCHDIPH